MPKKIVYCADGTWKHPGDPTTENNGDTNIVKIKMLAEDSPDQKVIYDNGIGVSFPEVLGGAFGVGIFGKIKQGYKQIADVYQKGDRIFLFGFSRGAYISRCLAGLLSTIGLPTQGDTHDAMEKAFGAYQLVAARDDLVKKLEPFAMDIPRIAMQGMFDTVGSLGITGSLFGLKDPAVYGFLDTDLHDNTEAAYHALAIDERRGEFKPTMWVSSGAAGQVLKQVWFTGVHSEVGGGSDEVGISNIALSWMLKNAEGCGLKLTQDADKFRAIEPKNALDAMKDSWNPGWAFPVRRSIPDGATIANSVAIRIEEDLTYRPKNLKIDASGKLDPGYPIEPVLAAPVHGEGILIPSNAKNFDTRFDIVAGTQYRFFASGSWVDQKPPGVGPEGVAHPGGIREGMNALKRVPSAPWMALLGKVDNGHWFVIGTDTSPKTLPAGRLYCCANDVPAFYGNNHGSILLDIEPV